MKHGRSWSVLDWFILLFNLILMVAMFSANVLEAKEVRFAPDFELVDPQGELHAWSEYKGKPTIIHFWATWCPYCKKLQPGLEKLSEEYRDTDLQVLGISFNEDEGAQPAQMLRARGINFPTLLKGEGAAKAYGVVGTPTTVFINRDGEIIWKTNISLPDDPKLSQATDYILKH
ncbi:peroxiredoxin [Shewanella sp. UCD-KL12]|uniref:peroxiredoxin family protein n=1 Tax=Shewanella sp. UCD-KL12 TaxID=1917163 RepID=UPI0009F88E49|nr:TlpA disulfide reductase family protein [Shewanella sp. UCD-KL12]